MPRPIISSGRCPTVTRAATMGGGCRSIPAMAERGDCGGDVHRCWHCQQPVLGRQLVEGTVRAQDGENIIIMAVGGVGGC